MQFYIIYAYNSLLDLILLPSRNASNDMQFTLMPYCVTILRVKKRTKQEPELHLFLSEHDLPQFRECLPKAYAHKQGWLNAIGIMRDWSVRM